VPAVTVETSQLRRSPLADRADELAAQTGGVTLAELPFLSMVNLRVTRTVSAAADRVQQALGVDLPGPGLVSTLGERSVLWLGPDEWLVVGPDGVAAGLVGLLGAAVAEGPGSVVDVSANRDTLVIGGSAARDLLEKGCTLDLHPRSFGAGQCAQTTFARGHVLIWQTADEAGQQTADGGEIGPVYRLLFRGSFADYFADWLIDAAAEFRH
jgi:sarcosine oxidase, subunit gamma